MDDHKTASPPRERSYETPPAERPITDAEAARAAALSANEHIKIASGYLRGTLADGLLKHATGAISDDDGQLVKFHGMYLQDDRDLRAERTKKKLEKAYSFMIRLRIAGGVVSPKQWLALDEIARTYANGTLRATTRQTFQYHGVIKSNLKRTMQAIDAVLLDTIAACGDVNRNVMAATNPAQTGAHKAAYQLAKTISDTLLPKTNAWREIWLDGERVVGGEDEAVEPIYGKTYLPRKFKIVVAVPPSNEVDIFAHDLGFIAILDKKNKLKGWNVTVGGGMGMTHGETDTFPRTADVMAFCEPEDALKVAEAVMTVQRDWGNRKSRKNARLKYTIERYGLAAFRAEVERRVGRKLQDPKPFRFESNGDRYGWVEGEDGRHHLTLYLPSGRIKDVEGGPRYLSGLRRIAEVHQGDFRLTGNQNVIVANVPADRKSEIDALVAEYGLNLGVTALRRNSLACVALPTCGLALAESERFMPGLLTELEESLAAHGLQDEDITIRMTGCPNGCARPYIAEIGFVGRGPERYNLYLGAAFDGSRLSKLYAEDVAAKDIRATLDPLFAAYARDRQPGERFGDFVIRAGFVAKTINGPDFHDRTGALKAVA
ncbi:NADPH-dependent assimilatory sulfite reductase hemoprotein subunit [Methylobacterium nodulans]|uniref:Sulfite reductase [NADPH] hemoprotein beta-component n=1 Tax=Methylobacterium nodulans (strain LMG 21967 / CNCM I-2342 / ORS 2060) TaxID=460265 RepID=CYSI_METNO|nr:NADPH-dependent assimilatory sulfite reductase hemoprotein subunit [Methylobacterium nodulans]B8IRY2.1 RecName: Full=Sulfite reductase [NADPH] hemoprotein beta-component; Short=SiR-HP; Short=SiRHP [Methylobacterium nodulans ORS 2060]ACL56794.1 sulfite reductase (NADPH) hemoprotein, beta-component [Methylobacterium nodulans ORS 2060]